MKIISRPDLRECAGRMRHEGDRRRSAPDRIVIHRNTASNDWFRANPDSPLSHVEALHRFHTESRWKFRIFPYHYFVDRDGLITQVHDEMTRAPHAPNRGNYRSIGIALNFDGRTEELPETVQRDVEQLCLDILSRYPGCAIMGHSDAKRCPGPLIRVHEIEGNVRDTLEARKLNAKEHKCLKS